MVSLDFYKMSHWSQRIFKTLNEEQFNEAALELFRFQAKNNPVYQKYIELIGIQPENISRLNDIPYLPIELFKSHKVFCGQQVDVVFKSSGTVGPQSSHHVQDIAIYEDSFQNGFSHFYGDITNYTILALLPSYLEREDSSLIYMCERLIKDSQKAKSGFYLYDHDALATILEAQEKMNKKTLLIGVSFALLDFAEKSNLSLSSTIVMETGGMKGRRKEMVRHELHQILKRRLGLTEVHSEYGMTELLSQAYAIGNERFSCPPWMRVSARDVNDPLSTEKQKGGLNIIDLANIHSCAFIATQDLGKVYADGSFEVLGRYDKSDTRGCNLMVV